MFRRLTFLADFLGALGAFQIEHSEISERQVGGTVVYAPYDDWSSISLIFSDWDEDERQEFLWQAGEMDVPSRVACLLVAMIREQRLLDIDKLKVDRDELFERFRAFYNLDTDRDALVGALEEIERVKVAMVDDGVIGNDHFFIHE